MNELALQARREIADALAAQDGQRVTVRCTRRQWLSLLSYIDGRAPAIRPDESAADYAARCRVEQAGQLL